MRKKFVKTRNKRKCHVENRHDLAVPNLRKIFLFVVLGHLFKLFEDIRRPFWGEMITIPDLLMIVSGNIPYSRRGSSAYNNFIIENWMSWFGDSGEKLCNVWVERRVYSFQLEQYEGERIRQTMGWNCGLSFHRFFQRSLNRIEVISGCVNRVKMSWGRLVSI